MTTREDRAAAVLLYCGPDHNDREVRWIEDGNGDHLTCDVLLDRLITYAETIARVRDEERERCAAEAEARVRAVFEAEITWMRNMCEDAVAAIRGKS